MDVTVFPISMVRHIIFAVVAGLFFLFQFIRVKRWYQIIVAIAIPITLLVYIDTENTVLFHGVGWAEAVLLGAAFIASTVQNIMDKKKEKQKKQNKSDSQNTGTPAATEG